MKLQAKLITLALATVWAAGVQAQAFPDKPVKILVGFAPGGSTDLVARVVAQRMATTLGQPFVVENRVGASGILATDALAKSPADGYTLGACSTSAFTILPYLMKSVRYDPVKDFQPVAQVGLAPYVLVANPKLNIHTLQDVIKLAKAKPGLLTYASGGQGSASHLAGELFSAQTGIKMTHVPYKGLAQAMGDVVSGQVDLAFDQEPSAGGNIRGQLLRPIAIAGKTRSRTLEEVPTFTEAGVPFLAAQWIGLCGPAGIPKDRVEALYKNAALVVQSTEVAARFQVLGVQPALLGPAAFGKAIDADRVKWKLLIDQAQIRID